MHILHLEDQQFRLGPHMAEPTVEGLLELFRQAGVTSESLLMLSSDVDFPEEAGLADDFDARGLVEAARKRL